MGSSPKELEPYERAYKLQANRKDVENWQLGQYISASIASVFFKKSKYPKEPMFQTDNDKDSIKCGNGNETVAVFEMKQRTNALIASGMMQSPS